MTHSQPEHRWSDQAAKWVPIDSLLPSDSPRLDGESSEHASALAASDASLPPILVHRSSMRVIDGMHRVRAAILRGQDEILAVYYDGDDDDAFIVAVESNITHGLPLSAADRTAAAVRIIAIRPQWSDRKIASVSGLAATTVGAIRKRSTDEIGQSNAAARVGIDGRVRPLNPASGRLLASELFKSRPDASIREIAAAAGVSPSTALDVRRRLQDGEDPVPERQRVTETDRAATDQNENQRVAEHRAQEGKRTTPAAQDNAAAFRRTAERPNGVARRPAPVDRDSVLRNLRKDPSLCFNEAGRALLRWLDSHSAGLEDWKQYTGTVPAHCTSTIAELARLNGRAWQELAEHLERGGLPRQ